MVLSPLVRHPGNLQAGVHSIEKPKKKQKLGFPIKDFGNDGGGPPLNGSITPLFVTPAIFKPGSRII